MAFLVTGAGVYFQYTNWILRFLSIIVCIHVLNKHAKAAYKITWIFLIMLFPIFGGVLYVFFYFQSNPRKLRRIIARGEEASRDAFYLSGNRLPDLLKAHPEFKPQAQYLQDFAGFPVYANTSPLYFDSGEAYFNRVYIQIINKAKEHVYINTPYLVIDDSLLSALCLAAKSGVDVRTIPASHEVSLEECARNAFQRFFLDVLRIFAPLM